ncbi:transmembrane protein 17B-like isoform X2 [Motacilla alba alba]|uniref:transmembrane protein 17B-like isoform X2 n=1 Tax=Motacilla alba alba TaxID=1094192 RepID=UPI0018D59593|nr:transmembrane protein 17B-like isoform X2 [Motacilla alba alba]
MAVWPCALAWPVTSLIPSWLIRAQPGWVSRAQLLSMAVPTPLPPSLRRGLVAFSGSLFINNRTWDSGTAHASQPAHKVLSSLPLQVMLYFNVYYFPVWCLAEGIMLHLKFLLVTAFLILSLAEGSRLYLGYLGNLQEKVPELAGFLLLSFLIQLPLLLFLLMDGQVIHLPLEVPMHSLLLAFLLLEIVAAFLVLRTMTKQLAAQFHLRQFQEGGRGRLEPGGTGGQETG